MVQIIVVGVPAHIRRGALVLVGSRDLGKAGHQYMRHSVHKSVAVAVAHTVYYFAFVISAALLDQHIKADLRGGYQL